MYMICRNCGRTKDCSLMTVKVEGEITTIRICGDCWDEVMIKKGVHDASRGRHSSTGGGTRVIRSAKPLT